MARYFAKGLKNLHPPEILFDSDEESGSPEDIEIENTQEREAWDCFLEYVNDLEPLVDTTQM